MSVKKCNADSKDCSASAICRASKFAELRVERRRGALRKQGPSEGGSREAGQGWPGTVLRLEREHEVCTKGQRKRVSRLSEKGHPGHPDKMLRLCLTLQCALGAAALGLRSQTQLSSGAPPSWIAVGPSTEVGSFDLFELASNGAKTKVLVTFPVDAAEVAQDGGEDRTGPRSLSPSV